MANSSSIFAAFALLSLAHCCYGTCEIGDITCASQTGNGNDVTSMLQVSSQVAAGRGASNASAGLGPPANGHGCPIVNVDTDLYSAINPPPRVHEWSSSFVGAIDYARTFCIQYKSSTIQKEHVAGQCLMMTQGDACCDELVKEFDKVNTGAGDHLRTILSGEGGTTCARSSDEAMDAILYPKLCEFTGADCLFSNIPVGQGGLAAEVYVCPDKRATAITNPAVAYTLAKDETTKPYKCSLENAAGAEVSEKFTKDPMKKDPRDWAAGIKDEAKRLDDAGQAGSRIPHTSR